MWGDDLVSFFCVWVSGFPKTICWRDSFFLMYTLDSFVVNKLSVDMCVYFWTLNSIPLVRVCLFCTSATLLWSLQLYSIFWSLVLDITTLTIFFLNQNCFGYFVYFFGSISISVMKRFLLVVDFYFDIIVIRTYTWNEYRLNEFIDICFVTQHLIYPRECSLYTLEECVFSFLKVQCCINVC